MPNQPPEIETPDNAPEKFPRRLICGETVLVGYVENERKNDNPEAFIQNVAMDLLCGRKIEEIRMRTHDDAYEVLGEVRKFLREFFRSTIQDVIGKITMERNKERIRRLQESGSISTVEPVAANVETNIRIIEPVSANIQINGIDDISFPEDIFHLPYIEAKDKVIDVFESFYFPEIYKKNGGIVLPAARAAGIDRKYFRKCLENRKTQEIPIHFPDALIDNAYKTAKGFVLNQFIMQYTRRLLADSQNNISQASRKAGIDRKHLRNLIEGRVGRGFIHGR